jgi:heme A synthase
MIRRTLIHWLAAIVFVLGIGGATLAVATPQTALACNDTLLTFPAWYKGDNVQNQTSCDLNAPPSDTAGLQTYIWTIVLNVINFLLQLVAYLAAGFIIFGGYKYLVSAGSSDGMSKAKTTITNAVVGLVLSLMAVAIVNVISGVI